MYVFNLQTLNGALTSNLKIDDVFWSCIIDFIFLCLDLFIVGRKWFMGQAHLPRENPKAQAEEDYGPSSTR